MTSMIKSFCLSFFLCYVTTGFAQANRVTQALSPTLSATAQLDRIVAIVNNEVITRYELNERLEILMRQLNKQGTSLPPRDVLEKQLLERIVFDTIQLQYAKETATRVDDIQLDRAIARIAETNNLSLPAFREALEKDGIAFNKFREEIRADIVISRVREREVDNKIFITEGEVDNYLNSKTNNVEPQEFNIGHILLRVPEQASPKKITELRAKAQAIYEQLKDGGDFSKTAISFSEAPDALQGGTLGWRQQDRLPALFVEALSKLQVGQITEVIKSPNGFHILKLLDRRGGEKQMPMAQQTHARHILIKTEGISDEEAKHKLVQLKERLENGANFAELAQAYSNDRSSAKGGDLGWLYPGDTVPEFEHAMDNLKIKEISAPIKTPYGWHLIEVLERRTADVSQDRLRLQARMALRARKADEAYQEWLRQLRDQAYVEYRLNQ